MTPTPASAPIPTPAPAPVPTPQHHANLTSFLSILERILTVLVPVGAAVAAPFLKSSGAQAAEAAALPTVATGLQVLETLVPEPPATAAPPTQ